EAITRISSALVSSYNAPRVLVAIGRATLANLHLANGDRIKAQPLFVQAEQELESLRAGATTVFPLSALWCKSRRVSVIVMKWKPMPVRFCNVSKKTPGDLRAKRRRSLVLTLLSVTLTVRCLCYNMPWLLRATNH